MHRHHAFGASGDWTTSDYQFRYALYGFVLACNAALDVPGLTAFPADMSTGPVDILVDLAGVATADDAPATPDRPSPHGSHLIVEPTGGWLAVSPTPGPERDWRTLRFGYADHHVQFDLAPDGTRTVVSWSQGIPSRYVSTLLVTTVMGFLLFLHRRLTIHASVVARDRVAYVIAGAQAAGKSTTLGALIQRGCAGVSDDVAALVALSDGWVAFCGPSGIRLTPAARAALGMPAAALAPIWPPSPEVLDVDYGQIEDKAVAFLEPAHRFDPGVPLPVAGVFLLASRSDELAAPRVTAVPPAAAVPALASHLSTPAWLDRTVDEQRFSALAALARCTPVRLVDRPDTLDALPMLCDALLHEMERLRP